MENKIKEMARMTIDVSIDEEPKVSALLQRKDGTIERFSGDSDYKLGMELLKKLDTNRLSSSNEDSGEVLIPPLSLSKEGDMAYITDEQIDALFE